MALAIIGGVLGLIIAWVILCAKTRTEYKGAGYFQFEGPGCFKTLLIYLIWGGIGAGVGFVVSLFLQQ